MDDYDYLIQELAYHQWFFGDENTKSVGARGVFSSHGPFTGPHAPCPPGGSLKKWRDLRRGSFQLPRRIEGLLKNAKNPLSRR